MRIVKERRKKNGEHEGGWEEIRGGNEGEEKRWQETRREEKMKRNKEIEKSFDVTTAPLSGKASLLNDLRGLCNDEDLRGNLTARISLCGILPTTCFGVRNGILHISFNLWLKCTCIRGQAVSIPISAGSPHYWRPSPVIRHVYSYNKHLLSVVKCEVLTPVTMDIAVPWDVTHCSLAYRRQRFGRTCCLCLQCRNGKK